MQLARGAAEGHDRRLAELEPQQLAAAPYPRSPRLSWCAAAKEERLDPPAAPPGSGMQARTADEEGYVVRVHSGHANKEDFAKYIWSRRRRQWRPATPWLLCCPPAKVSTRMV